MSRKYNNDENGGTFLLRGAALWLTILLAVVLLGGIVTAFVLVIQHDIVNPQVRRNLVDDPQRSIDVKRSFHTKLAEVITADNNILAVLDQIDQFQQDHPRPWSDDEAIDYDNLSTQLTSLKAIRSDAIDQYNRMANNPDDGKFRDAWLPAQLDQEPLPSGEQDLRQFLSNEVRTLSAENLRQ